MQDAHHYITSWESNALLQRIQNTDSIQTYQFTYFVIFFIDFPLLNKQERALHENETLVVVPCWWDGERERYASVVTSLSFVCFIILHLFCFVFVLVMISLMAAVRFQRPDITFFNEEESLDSHADVIPLNPPLGFFPCTSPSSPAALLIIW